MAKIGHVTKTTKFKMDSILIRQGKPRHYLGASGLGDPCARKIYYDFRHATKRPPINGRTQRIFDTGNLAEDLIKKHLEYIGVSVRDDQLEVKGFMEYGLGHIDGIGSGFIEFPDQDLLTEFKAVNEKTFLEFYKNGCEKTNITYYSQTQYYMGKLKLPYCAFIVINKNTSQMHIEFIPFDNGFYQDLLRKEQDIIASDVPPRKGYPDNFYKCNFCDHGGVCSNGASLNRSCRTCDFVELSGNGGWFCNKKKFDLDFDAQIAACKHWININWS